MNANANVNVFISVVLSICHLSFVFNLFFSLVTG